ncbi:Fic family protein [Methylotuvimicrobium alcaliphilum]|uniref:Filamentation induced by cAMP protein Fic n=1 Tax=Methylotuvimicrobium alcaliphilum (strain DSM 19304 / NCIMB 14124 / VKM B-2133 / 20Z) TaxID=1091494 RepID=G4T423_META2|nr:Fic family protein [Methylotuvimicrobium alcaliphilum]CCE23758.1 Filamentation induced by cAMP protein Fic [Methylotuvimicrobium alcaliphilum 20Z]
MFERCDQLKAELDARRPLPPHTLKSLHDHWVLEWTYNSNAIEGNTLTLKETKVVLEGITIGGKSMREHFEVINHKNAIDYVEAVIAGDEAFSERLIKAIHQLVLKNIDSPNAGVYRHENVLIAGSLHRPPDFLPVPEQMAELVESYHAVDGHPLERAARLHVDFVKIHPFVDGNGRTARLLMNFDLMKAGFLPVIFQAADRLAYYEALDKAHIQNDYRDFFQLSIAAEVKAFETVLSLLTH